MPVGGALVFFRSISGGLSHTCAFSVARESTAGEGNRWGQLGTGDVPHHNFGLRSLVPVRATEEEAALASRTASPR